MITEDKGNFAKGSILKILIRLSLPMMLAEVVQLLYNIVDRIYIGHMEGCGTIALTGLGLVLPLTTFISAFANLCSYGGATLSAIERGKGDDKKALDYEENAFTLLVAFGAILMIVLFIIKRPILYLMGADDETIVYALEYFKVYLIGTIFVLICLGMNPFINFQGFPGVGMLTVIIGAVLNIILDPLFIFNLNMGIKGAAWATVISQFCGSMFVTLFLLSKKVPLRIRRLHLEKDLTVEILKLGVSGFCFRATNSFTQGVVNATLKLWGGELSTLYIASMSVINSIREFGTLPIEAIRESMKPIISYNYGAKMYSRVRKTINTTIIIVFVFNVMIWSLTEFFPRIPISLFTGDEELIALSVPCLKAFFVAYPLMTFQSVPQNIFVALNHPGYATFFSLLRKIGLIIPFTILLPYTALGVMGVFWAEAVSEVVGATACCLTMYFVVYRKLKLMKDCV